jgi:hypothetical protein
MSIQRIDCNLWEEVAELLAPLPVEEAPQCWPRSMYQFALGVLDDSGNFHDAGSTNLIRELAMETNSLMARVHADPSLLDDHANRAAAKDGVEMLVSVYR